MSVSVDGQLYSWSLSGKILCARFEFEFTHSLQYICIEGEGQTDMLKVLGGAAQLVPVAGGVTFGGAAAAATASSAPATTCNLYALNNDDRS
jgi:hypothetical protein